MNAEPLIVAIDGPAGVGKSTAARRLADALGIAYLDTGAMYRTLGLCLGAEAADMTEDELRRRASACRFALECPPGGPALLRCNDEPVGDEIRSEKAGRLASLMGRLPALRLVLQEAQRAMGRDCSLVAEGRDMGTTVFPRARRKFFLDARPEVRAERRFLELTAKGEAVDKDAILADIIARDEQDRNRAVDPLRPAPDAVIVDTSDLGPDEVLAVLLAAVREEAPALSHIAPDGSARMVDVGPKPETARVARARAVLEMNAHTLALLRQNALPKGDALAVAKTAGILAAKRASGLIPLCHPLALTFADVTFAIQEQPPAVLIESEVRTFGRTGAEMEAIVAVQIAAATVYDMAKAVQKDMIIRDVRLVYKSGGKSGEFSRE